MNWLLEPIEHLLQLASPYLDEIDPFQVYAIKLIKGRYVLEVEASPMPDDYIYLWVDKGKLIVSGKTPD